MKKILLILFCVLSTTIFGEINDSVGIFSSKELPKLEKTINKLEQEKDIKIYLNTVVGKESFQLENPQKTVIIILQQLGENLFVTELKFTEDLKMGEKSQEIDIILDSLKEKLFNRDYIGYTEKLIKDVGELLPLESVEEGEHFPEDSGNIKKSFFKRIFSKNP